ncbi:MULTISPECIES: LysM peptidoglycan-binding domain-containing protein [Paenibacillus]|uniref:Peptidoglycan-binding lysin domain-containing protein n=1 Tax=Paenibacillus amylolyticus TaxID=1451 RepID=A0A100VSX5_PAEAM|nr:MULTISPECIES: LysM peptidoglycan-binding domain-containing protein [Paenibacillus]GAS85464.1 peptidoglycan-binding lysin domain-containing protein [Paenibacillus amylolyticus]
MLNQPYGLRFDIYERVHLSEGVPAIEELEEIELYPRIQVIGQDDHATLRGHLLLTGAYRGENEASEELKHFIPVEITVPLNRVRSIDDISIEIENFDVDLLSNRSLNITGVLSLRGIEGFPVEEPQVWSADEFTVVHSPDIQQSNRSEESEQPAIDPNAFAQEYLLQRSEEERLANAAELAYGAPEFADLQDYANASSAEPLQSEEQSAEYANENRQPDANEDLASLAANGDELASHEQYSEPSPISSFMAETADRLASYPESEPLLPLEEEPSAWSEPSVDALPANPRSTDQAVSEPTAQSSNELAAPDVPDAPDVWHFESARSVPQQENQAVADVPVEPQAENWQGVFASSEPGSAEEDRPSFEAAGVDEFVQNEAFVPEPVAETEDKPELKVAFGSKKESAPRQEEGVGISSLLSSGRAARDAEVERGDEVPAGVVQEETYPADDVEWKNLFLGTIVDQTPFRKVKLCIVQREDTLDAIADRYQLSTRELQLYNRLSEQVVEEGQILYIP